MSQRVLVVEDEPAIAESVAYALRRDGFEASIAPNASAAATSGPEFDLVILDLMLPDGSGFDLISRWRQHGHRVPVIVLSSRDAEADRVALLEIGADDYVTKPFSPREVVARVRAVLRRTQQTDSVLPPVWEPSNVAVDPVTRRASLRGKPLELTRVEFDLLACLVEHPGRVYTRAELIDRVWGDGFAISDRTVDSHIKGLRRKLGEIDSDSGLIETVRGVGYRYEG